MELLQKFENQEAPFDLVSVELVKLMDHISEEGVENIVSAYNTPAERIVKSLMFFK